MKIVVLFNICILFLTISSAIAAPRIGQRPEGICTLDINTWGNPSQCFCEKPDIYDNRAGLCFDNSGSEKITVHGTLLAGIAAIGGETTGFVIETKVGGSYELILKLDEQKKLNKLSGQWFEVSGEYITIKSVEIAERKAIIVEKLAVLE